MPFADCGFDSRDGVSGGDRLAALGPTISVRIGFDPASSLFSERLPDLPARLYPALIDTGASESCIDSTLAESLHLPVMERKRMAGVLGAGVVETRLAQIQVPTLAATIYGPFAGVPLSASGFEYRAILGRTFLQQYTLTYYGTTGAVRLVGDPL